MSQIGKLSLLWKNADFGPFFMAQCNHPTRPHPSKKSVWDDGVFLNCSLEVPISVANSDSLPLFLVEAVHEWLQSHLGAASDDAVTRHQGGRTSEVQDFGVFGQSLMSPKTWRPLRCVKHLSTFKEPVKTRVQNLSTVHGFCVGSVGAVRTCTSILCSLFPCFAPWFFSLVFASIYFDCLNFYLQFLIWLCDLRNRFNICDFPEIFCIHTTITLHTFFIKYNYHLKIVKKMVRYPDIPWLGLPLFRSHVAQLAALEATLGQFASHRTWGALDVEARGDLGGEHVGWCGLHGAPVNSWGSLVKSQRLKVSFPIEVKGLQVRRDLLRFAKGCIITRLPPPSL